MPDMSVLLPAHNEAKNIGVAVSSTLRALPRDAELVVLDDGSTDGTAEIAERAGRGDRRLRIISQPPSGGITPALTALLKATDSRIVGRMDGDDISLPGRFRATLPKLVNHDLAFTQMIDWQGKSVKPLPPVPISAETFPLHLLLINPVAHSTMVAHRSVIDEVGGYRRVPAEDYDLWLRCAAAGARMTRVPHWGLVHRIHPDQLTASQTWRSNSWDNPEQAKVFADLAEQLTGERLPRLVSLVDLPALQREAELAAFEAAITPAIASIRGVRGRLLEKRLRTRLAWVRNFASARVNQEMS